MSSITSIKLKITGMTCINCQNKIEKKLRDMHGIVKVKVSFRDETAEVTYDKSVQSVKRMAEVIDRLGYQVIKGPQDQESYLSRVIGILMIIVSLYVLLQQFDLLNILVPSQLADTGMGYGMLFVIGLITSIHCIAMCGGINLSQCIPRGTIKDGEQQDKMVAFMPALLYNLGRVISYTVIGFILGFAGFLFGGGSGGGLPIILQGLLKILAGIFMVIMGMNMLGMFPFLRRLNLHMPKFLAGKIGAKKAGSSSPLMVGLLNGLMPCGPLQSMQIVALASGNPLVGALSMFLFSVGTVPLMLGLGSIVSALGKKFTKKMMDIGAVLVVVLGLAMLSQGGSLSGMLPPRLILPILLAFCIVGIVSGIPFSKKVHRWMVTGGTGCAVVLAVLVWNHATASGVSSVGTDIISSEVEMVDGQQVVKSTLSSRDYPDITVKAGTPVRWIIDAPDGSINGCNNQMNIQEYGIINYAFQPGENIVEFTPTEKGTFDYSCWMGMIYGSITVE